MTIDRRAFIKSSLTGVAGLSLVTPMLSKTFAASNNGLVWTDKMPINPDISNMKVVCFHDPDMCSLPTSSSFDKVNQCVDDEKVSMNMDIMAMELSGKTTPNEAWKTIFRSGKEWNETKVMLKVNSINATNLPRVAVVKKITDVLFNLGVQPANMTVFDGHGDASGEAMKKVKYVPFASLTDATKIRANISNRFNGVGGTQSFTFPDISTAIGAKDLVTGNIDIIVNIAVNRGHDQAFNGRTTLCLKNHYGTFISSSDQSAAKYHSFKSLMDMNKHELLVGGNPVRQQLCIIDSLFAAKQGPFENGASDKPDRLLMGTFAGAVDYCCVKKIRQTLMKMTTHDDTIIAKYLTEFGYQENDVQWIEMTPSGVTTQYVTTSGSNRHIDFSFSHPSMRRVTIRFAVPVTEDRPLRTRVFDMRGNLVTDLHSPAGTATITWDGRSANGRLVGRGRYVVVMNTGTFKTAENLTVL